MVIVAAVTLLVGCAEDRNSAVGPDAPHGVAPPGGTAVNGIEREWAVVPDLNEVEAGPITFTFKNIGTVTHEMLVVKTDLPVGELPVDPVTNRFDEESPDWEVVDEIPEYEVGETKELTLDLEPGNYQLVCNIPTHYQNGMFAGLTVYG